MKILILSLSNLDLDGRSRALIDIFCHLGEVKVIINYKRKSYFLRDKVYYCNPSLWNFITILRFFFGYIKKTNSSDLIMVDNRKAALLALLLYPIIKNRTLIYDMRELYTCEESKSIINKLGTYLESYFIGLADLVICANKHRARIVQVKYSTKIKPLVIENNRSIFNPSKISNNKLSDIISSEMKKFIESSANLNKLNFVSTDGFSIQRKTQSIINQCAQFNNEINLFIFGNNQDVANNFIRDNNFTNIVHMGSVDGNVLGELLNNFIDVGIVVYGEHDLNNKYCASGKIYEFIHMGIPVVTSYNAPLRQIIRNNNVGFASNNLKEAIIKVINNFNYYKHCSKKAAEKMDVNSFEVSCSNKIKEMLN